MPGAYLMASNTMGTPMVFVDDMRAKYGRYVMCHMLADSDDELHAMAAQIGVARRWHQAPPAHDSHYDISLTKRAQAIQAGAVEITWRQASCMVLRRRITGALGTPETALEWRQNHVASKKTTQVDQI